MHGPEPIDSCIATIFDPMHCIANVLDLVYACV